MKIGIVGSTGFLGSNLIFYLKKKNLNVFSFQSYYHNKKNWTKNVQREIIKKKPDIIINCAASQFLNDDIKSITELFNSNLYSNIVFLKRAMQNSNFKGYISFGSKWELTSSKNKKPMNFYAVSKKANEIFYEYFSNNTTSIISLKVFDTYGPGDKRKKFLNDLYKSYKKNKILNITSGQQYLDYVHINDLCLLIEKIIFDIKSNKLKGFKSFSVSSKKPLKLIDLVKKLKKILNKKLKVNIGKKKYRTKESFNKPSKFFNYPGWKIKHELFRELKLIFDKK